MKVLWIFGLVLIVSFQNDLGAQNCVLAEFRLDGSAADSSGNGYHGTILGASPTTDRSGMANSAYMFDGVDDYIDAGTNLGNFGSSDFTVEFWIKTSSSENMRILGKREICMHSNFWNIGIRDGKFEAELDQNSSGSPYHVIKGKNNFDDDNWHLVQFVRDSNILKLYVDSVLDTMEVFTSVVDLSNVGNFRLGHEICANGGFTESFDGVLDDVRIYNCAIDTNTVPNSTLHSSEVLAWDVHLYPNPGSDFIRFDTQNRLKSIEIIDALGSKKNVPLSGSELDVRQLSNGVYFVKFESENGLILTKTWIKNF